MTGVVLALAGLTAGDAGPGSGAATAPATVSLVGEWSGTMLRFGEGSPEMVMLRDGTLRYYAACGGGTAVCAVSTDRWGRSRAAWAGIGFSVAWRQEGRKPPTVYLRGRYGVTEFLITLRPAAPSKP
jgi:hypothetical protein